MSAAVAANFSYIPCNKWSRATGSLRKLHVAFSALERHRRSWINRSMRDISFSIREKIWVVLAESDLLFKIDRPVLKTANGERSSWEATATKCLCLSSFWTSGFNTWAVNTWENTYKINMEASQMNPKRMRCMRIFE